MYNNFEYIGFITSVICLRLLKHSKQTNNNEKKFKFVLSSCRSHHK